MYYLIFKAYIDASSSKPLGIAEIIFVTTDKAKAQHFLAQEQQQLESNSYLNCYACPSDTDLRQLTHYPSIEFNSDDFR